MKAEARREYVQAAARRYRTAKRGERSRILDALCADTGYNRKYAMALLRPKPAPAGSSADRAPARLGRPPRYGPAEISLLQLCWAVADGICGKRLAPFLPELLAQLAVAGELPASATDAVVTTVQGMSASTIDRVLAGDRAHLVGKGRALTKPGSLLKRQVPIKTFAEWDDAVPGFLEMDLVAHCGTSGAGEFLFTLAAVDVATGWIALQGVLNRGEAAVFRAITDLRRRLPFPLRGIDTDNGSEFINHNLVRYCQQEGITLTRGRPYRKNDACYIEQKNWSVVRRLIGYARFEGVFALEALNAVFRLAEPYVNFLQPSRKLTEKLRDGARITRRYDAARTPYRRLIDTALLAPDTAARLVRQQAALRPKAIKRAIDEAQTALECHALRSDSLLRHR